VVSNICGGRIRWRALRSDLGIAGPGLDADVELHLLDGGQQVALHVDRQRLQRRDIEGMEPVGGRLDQVGERRQESRQRLARAGRRDEQRVAPGARGIQHVALVAARRPAPGCEPAGQDGWQIPHARSLMAAHMSRRRRELLAIPSYIGVMAKLGSWIEPQPHGIYMSRRGCLGRSLASRAAGARHPRPCRSCARRPRQVWATPETLAIMEMPLWAAERRARPLWRKPDA
jgi:hypothetical protein